MKLSIIMILLISISSFISCGEGEKDSKAVISCEGDESCITSTTEHFLSLDDTEYRRLSCSFLKKDDISILSIYVAVPSYSGNYYMKFAIMKDKENIRDKGGKIKLENISEYLRDDSIEINSLTMENEFVKGDLTLKRAFNKGSYTLKFACINEESTEYPKEYKSSDKSTNLSSISCHATKVNNKYLINFTKLMEDGRTFYLFSEEDKETWGMHYNVGGGHLGTSYHPHNYSVDNNILSFEYSEKPNSEKRTIECPLNKPVRLIK